MFLQCNPSKRTEALRLRIRSTAIAALPLLFVIGCGGTPTVPGPVGPVPADFQSVISSAGDYVNPTPRDNVGPPTVHTDSTATDGSIWACTTREVDIVSAPAELFLFQESGRVYPGALMQGGTLDQDPPSPILLARGPGRVALDINTGQGDSTFVNIPEASSEVVGNAINRLVRNLTLTPARMVVSVQNIRSKEELRLKMQVSGSGFGASGAGDFSFRSDRAYTRRLVTLEQVFFKARFPRPADASKWFAPSVTASAFKELAAPGNPPVYVREVTYGRLVYILIEAASDSQTVDAKISGSYTGLTGSVSGVAETNYVGSLDRVTLQACFYGGTIGGDDLAAAFTAPNAAAFNGAVGRILGAQQVPGGGLPLSYTLSPSYSPRPGDAVVRRGKRAVPASAIGLRVFGRLVSR